MITEAMLSKANEAYFNSRGNDVEKLRAALASCESELLAQGMEKAAGMGDELAALLRAQLGEAKATSAVVIDDLSAAIRASAAQTRGKAP